MNLFCMSLLLFLGITSDMAGQPMGNPSLQTLLTYTVENMSQLSFVKYQHQLMLC